MLNLQEYAPAAKRLLPRALYAYVSSYAGDGKTFADNLAVFDRWRLIPRVLRGVAHRSTETTLFGRQYAAPIGMAPVGAAAVLGYQADLAMARAAHAANVPYILSGNSITSLEAVIAANQDAWFAAYLPSDPAIIEAMMRRVDQAGFKVLVVTVDVPVAASRESEQRAHYTMPVRINMPLVLDMLTHPRWLLSRFGRTVLAQGIPRIRNITPDRGPSILARTVGSVGGAEAFTWEHIRSIRRLWPGKLLLKGVLSRQDAVLARECGVDGLIVSNHGARTIDSVVTPLQVLPAIRAACPEMTILLDGGVRRAGDVLKAIALGADAVLVGRPFFYAAILGGQVEIARALSLIMTELKRDMGFLGILRVEQIREGHLHDQHEK